MKERRAAELIARVSDHISRLGEDRDEAIRLFHATAFARSLAGKRTNLRTVLDAIDNFDESFGQSLIAIFSRRTCPKAKRDLKRIQFDVARLGVDRSSTKYGEPMFHIIGNHYLFQRRSITFIRELAPLVISYHSLKRDAQRSPEFETHSYGVLQYLKMELPFLLTMAIVLSGAAARGYLPIWARVPLPVKHGLFLTEFVRDPFASNINRYGWRLDKHGHRQIPTAIEQNRIALKISTFVSNDMLSRGQLDSANRLKNVFSPWPEIYESLTRFDRNGYDPLEIKNSPHTDNVARELVGRIEPFALKSNFSGNSRGLRQLAA